MRNTGSADSPERKGCALAKIRLSFYYLTKGVVVIYLALRVFCGIMGEVVQLDK